MSFKLPPSPASKPRYEIFPDGIELLSTKVKLEESRVMLQLLTILQPASGVIRLSEKRRVEIGVTLKLNYHVQLSRALRKLIELHAIKKIDMRMYLVNPHMFWRGSMKSRQQFILTHKDIPYFSAPVK